MNEQNDVWHIVICLEYNYYSVITEVTVQNTEMNTHQHPGRGWVYSLYWPIRGGSAQKGYLFQASGI